MTIFPRPSDWVRSSSTRAQPAGAPAGQHLYLAFLSYSHRDEKFAQWLQDALERFRVPHQLVGQLTDHGAIPRRLTPIFRDYHELAASSDLGTEIRDAIAASRFLIVLCSPAAARSRWVNAEIEEFKRVRPEGCVLAAIIEGEPFASDIPGREAEECFAPALRFKFDRRGRATARRAEPLAADFRESGDGRRLGFLKLVAGMLGVGLDEIVRRDHVRRQRNLAMVTAASIAGMAVTSTLALTAIQARDAARDQRREAESLIGFMLGDLRSKLEPVGRLDALDGVGSRVLAYYQKQDTSDLPDAALLQRSRALSLVAEVAYMRGDLNAAGRFYLEAMAGTGEAIRRNPDDPERLFEHAQNVFWVGDMARQRGDFKTAESAAREYKRLASRMVALDSDNMRWRMEEQNAEANLGITLYEQRRFGEAAAQFEQALRTIEALATADSRNAEYQKSRADSLAWLADARMSEGRLDEAIRHRQRHLDLLYRLQRIGDVDFRLMLIPAHRALGNLHAALGRVELATEHLQKAVSFADEMIPTEPGNTKWIEYGANAHLNLAEHLIGAGSQEQALRHVEVGCALARRLTTRDGSVMQWRVSLRTCLTAQVRSALASGGNATGTLALAQQAVATAKSIRTNDGAADGHAAARTYRLLGDVYLAANNRSAAEAAWRAGLAHLPLRLPERPGEMGEHLILLQRLGRTREASPLAERLKSLGYQLRA